MQRDSCRRLEKRKADLFALQEGLPYGDGQQLALPATCVDSWC